MKKIILLLIFSIFLTSCSENTENEPIGQITYSNVSDVEIIEIKLVYNDYNQPTYHIHKFKDGNTTCYIFSGSQRGGLSCVK